VPGTLCKYSPGRKRQFVLSGALPHAAANNDIGAFGHERRASQRETLSKLRDDLPRIRQRNDYIVPLPHHTARREENLKVARENRDRAINIFFLRTAAIAQLHHSAKGKA
jgi:hypothetical protein